MQDDARYPLSWVPGFVKSIQPYIHLRRADSLMIVLPNQAYKMNSTALDLLEYCFDNDDLNDHLLNKTVAPHAQRDAYYFFCDLKALISGCLGDGRGRKAVEQVPYTIPFSQLPILSEYALTYRCNLACAFCYAACNCKKTEQLQDELSTKQAKKILQIIRSKADVPSISFTGGEPTLRRDLPELISFARALGMRVNLISNGTLIDVKLARKLSAARLNSAQISIEGPSAEIHDKLTAVEGSFASSLNGIRNLISAGIATQTNTTLNSENAKHATAIVEMIADLGLKRFAMNMLTPSGSAIHNKYLYLRYSDVGAIVKDVARMAKQKDLEFFWYSPTPYCLFNPVAEGLGNKSCAACDGLLSVDPAGNVLPCSSFDEGVGNLIESDFETIWRSSQATFWRHKEYAPAECSGCTSLTACAAACPLYWEACGTGELNMQDEKRVS